MLARPSKPRTPEQLAQRRAAMLAAAPVGMLLLDSQCAIVEANAAAKHVLGLAPERPSLKPLRGRLVDPARGTVLEDAELPWQRALRGEQVHNVDIALTLPGTGQRRLLTFSALPFDDPGAAAPGALVIVVDRVQFLLRMPLPETARRRRRQLPV